MKLKEYLDITTLSLIEMAELAGIDKSSIYQALKGGKITLDTALSIQIATKMKVTCEDLASTDFVYRGKVHDKKKRRPNGFKKDEK